MRKFLLLLFIATSSSFIVSAQDFSNKGKEFWLAYSYHVGMVNTGGTPSMTLNITSDVTTTYTVEIYGVTTIAAGTVFANTVVNVTIPNAYFVNGDGLFNGRAIHVTAVKPIVVYSFITRAQASAATLCLPSNVLGRQYYSTNFNQVSNENNSAGYITIIAVEDNTSVEIIPTEDTRNWVAGSVNVVNLNKGEVYQVLGKVLSASTGTDITGTSVRSIASGANGCKKIAVFSGSGKILIGGCTNGADNLYQQLYPVSSWGKKFLTVPSNNRPHNYYRIMRSDPAANIYLNGVLLPGGSFFHEYFQFDGTLPNMIESDLPISVAQYFTTQNCAGNGAPYDPDMIILNPVEQNISDVTLVSTNRLSGSAASHQHNLHVIMTNKGTGISSFKYDGTSIPPGSWIVHPQDPNYSYLYIGGLSETIPHNIKSDSGFNALAYGYADFETYGYSAGTNVRDLNQQLEVSTTYGIETTPNVCTGAPFTFKVYFPDSTNVLPRTEIRYDSIRWDCSNVAVMSPNNFPLMIRGTGTPAVVQPDSLNTRNGKPVAWYSLPTPYSFTAAGTYDITLTVYRTSSEGCGNEQEYEFQITVSDPPTASFSVTPGGCYTETYTFKETTPQTPKPTYHFWWDFGDPASGANNISNLRNPTHIFSAPSPPGVPYKVRFADITTPGCLSDTVEQFVTVPDLPTATMTGATTVCINTVSPSITFTGSGGTAEYFFDYKINGGATLTTPKSVGNVYNLPIPTNVAGTFQYELVAVRNADPAGTTCVRNYTGVLVDVAIEPDHTLALTSGSNNQTLCESGTITNIVYTVGGGANNATVVFSPALPGVTGTYNAATKQLTIAGTVGNVTATAAYNFTVTTTGNSCNPATPLSGTITVNADAAVSLNAASGPATQTVCVNKPISNIIYDIQEGGTNANVVFTPVLPGVNGVYNIALKQLIISGTPSPAITAPATYNYTITATGPCLPASLTGSITVEPDHTLTLTSGSNNQTLCEGGTISNIIYTVGGGGNNASVIFTPALPGVTGTYNAATKELTIAGTVGNVAVTAVHSYTVTTTGNSCNPAIPMTGTITVNADAAISLNAASGPATQTVCVNKPISNIIYDIQEGGTNANVVFTPALPGVSGSYNILSKQFTISGSPNPAITTPATYNYTITATGPCLPASLTGSIVVEPDHTLTLTSGTNSQSLCEGGTITNIVYTVGGGGNTATVTGLPPGVAGTYNAATKELTIAGTVGNVTANTTYTYTVTTTGNSCQPAIPMTGTIIINADAALSLNAASGPAIQTVCFNKPISSIVYDIQEGGNNATVVFTPPLTGVSGTYNAALKQFTISGSPNPVITAPTTYNYTITATGPCLPASLTGSITVEPDHTLTLTSGSNNQSLCEGGAITAIVYTVGGGGNNANVTGLPPGVTGTYNAGTQQLTIAGTTGAVTATTTYNYTVTTTGNSCQSAIPLTGTIIVKADGDINLLSGITIQEVCRNVPIGQIVFTIAGGATGASISPALPAGITGVYNAAAKTFTVQGTPTVAPSSQLYTITTTGSTCLENIQIINLTINELPTPGFTYSSPTCDGQTITFTSNSMPNSGNINSWVWNFGDGNTDNSGGVVTHSYAPGTYDVTLSVGTDKNCFSPPPPALQKVTVYANPKAGFVVPEACVNDIVTFTDTSKTAPLSTITNWDWDFGDIASGPNNTATGQFGGVHQFTSPNTYIVKLTITTDKGCKDVFTYPITINAANPSSLYTINNQAALCSSDSVELTNKSTVAFGNISKLEIYWNNIGAPGIIETDDNPLFNKVYKHKYPTQQTTVVYEIRMRAFSGNICFADHIQSYTVYATPKVQFNPLPDACWDAAPYALTQGSEIGGVAGTGQYSGPGITGTNIFNPAIAGIGSHIIKYTYTSSSPGACIDTLSRTLIVRDTATASFSYASPVCDGNAVAFKDESSAPPGIVLSNVTWNFGDGSPVETHPVGATVSHVFPDALTYPVSLYNTSDYGCKSTLDIQPVKISPQPEPKFNFVQTSVCLPDAFVSVINNSSISDGSPLVYTWDFGDGSLTSSGVAPSHIYKGNIPYVVTLTAESEAHCKKTTTNTVDFIHPQPKAAYSTNRPSVCIGDEVTFTDKTDPLDGTTVSRSWKLGDGGIRSDKTFAYTYSSVDSFYVQLFITNSHGCNSDTTDQLFAVYDYPVVDAGIDREVLEGGSIKLDPTATGQDLTYLWTPDIYFNNKNNIKQPTASLIKADITYLLSVTGIGGCTKSDKMFIKVLKFPIIANTFTPNNDGINDVWSIQYLNTYPDNRVQVFTRSGQLVFESHGYNKPWDGTIKGKSLPIDTYYYVIEPGNGREPITGYVTILK